MNLKTVATQAKYGLVKKSGGATVKEKPVPLKRPVLASAFRDELESDDDNLESDRQRVNLQLQKRSKTAMDSMTNALSGADVSIYDYDGAYDTFKAAEITSHPLSSNMTTAPKAKYVNNLMNTAKIREKERERIYEKKLLKERKEEDGEFGDKEKFLTSAYKKKLMEAEKWEYEEKLTAEIEQQRDVKKIGMQGFYSNLLTKNVSMGGDVSNAVSFYTSGSNRNKNIIDESNLHNNIKSTEEKNEELINDEINIIRNDINNDNNNINNNSNNSDNNNNNDDNNNIVIEHQKMDESLHDNSSNKPQEQETELESQKVLTKEEQIQLARSRYLARKQGIKS
eukprot:gene10691-14357_t